MSEMQVTPEEIGMVRFKRAGFGRRGYDTAQVDEYLGRIAQSMHQVLNDNNRLGTAADRTGQLLQMARVNNELQTHARQLENQLQATLQPEEIEDLQRQLSTATWGLARTQQELSDTRMQLARAQEELEQARTEIARAHAGSARDQISASGNAMTLLTQAQESADSVIESAERHARDLVAAARRQQREILERVRANAMKLAEPAAAPADGTDLDNLRTYARVAKVQLQAVVAALSAEIDKIDDLPSGPPTGGMRLGPAVVVAPMEPSPTALLAPWSGVATQTPRMTRGRAALPSPPDYNDY
ncbi:DivIVA domain-containing protein [Nocardia stercoris]|uniref:DivIVA domain-containing protein n=1 Tax=Nocardia stercoris TaxID=2483361 RepID=A0A3M2LF93_9NOCA|nr:DivIVA domain-containing protein [Nocardia stercoris]RMI35490.1 DivIVA domain-containing protein [Nocardia stercoris]